MSFTSKYATAFAAFLFAITLQAQKNSLWDRSFWKTNPTIAAVKAEVEKGNSPTQANRAGFDATVYAITEQASNETIKYLLSLKENDVNKITHDGRTYIFWAAYKGNTELMEHLLSKGAKTNVHDDHGYTYANFSAANGQSNLKVYDLALKNGADFKKDLDHNGANALLLIAPHDKDFTLINYFVSKGLDIKATDANGNTAFNYAAKTGNIPFLKELLKKGVKFTDNAMIMASQGTRGTSNSLEVYQYLESLKIKPTATGKNGETALHNLMRKEKQNDIISYFLSKGVDINKGDNEGTTALMNAAASANTSVLDLIAPKIKDINQTNKKGMSALSFAVRSNSPEVVSSLISKGAKTSVLDANGDNLAYYLIQYYSADKSEIFEGKLKVLEQNGLKADAVQTNGNTLYHLAVAKNDLGLVKRVASFKPAINAKNKEGYTALQKAAMTSQNTDILKFLIESGADKTAVTEFKETAYDLASENESFTKNNLSIDFLK